MDFNKVGFLLIPSNLFGLTRRVGLSHITLCNEAQNGDGICFVTQRVKMSLSAILLGISLKTVVRILTFEMDLTDVG